MDDDEMTTRVAKLAGHIYIEATAGREYDAGGLNAVWTGSIAAAGAIVAAERAAELDQANQITKWANYTGRQYIAERQRKTQP